MVKQIKGNDKEKGEEYTDKNEKPFQCEICYKSFERKVNLIKHIAVVHEKTTSVRCDLCTKIFSQSHHLKEHISSVHERNKQFKCEYCNKAFTSKGNMDRHIIRVHEGKKLFHCEICLGQLNLRKSDLIPSFMGPHLKSTVKELRKCFFGMDDNDMFYLCKAHQKLNSI